MKFHLAWDVGVMCGGIGRRWKSDLVRNLCSRTVAVVLYSSWHASEGVVHMYLYILVQCIKNLTLQAVRIGTFVLTYVE